MSGSRSPRDVRQIVWLNRKEENAFLEKKCDDVLKLASSTSANDADVLRSRVDQQSELISLLKRRSEDFQTQLSTLETKCATLETDGERLRKSLREERERKELMEKRFFDLNSNHEQMIELKDEYKGMNAKLRDENSRLLAENQTLFSGRLQERDEMIRQLESHVTTLDERCRLADARTVEIERKGRVESDRYERRVDELVRELDDERRRFERERVESRSRIESLCDEARKSDVVVENERAERVRLGALVTEKDCLLREKESCVDRLAKENERLSLKMTALERRFSDQVALVNRDEQVMRLRETVAATEGKLDGLRREYDAYKKHSAQLLNKERELNSKLRHLLK
ncbi:coiled-coil domain-containing protein 89-like [Oscarella lobularis]|uniref:coiled-coil domain-containing protein 89-like n=1 Tax=Oscarella lobularis TaxID=121494 RepID=UPI0033141FF0